MEYIVISFVIPYLRSTNHFFYFQVVLISPWIVQSMAIWCKSWKWHWRMHYRDVLSKQSMVILAVPGLGRWCCSTCCTLRWPDKLDASNLEDVAAIIRGRPSPTPHPPYTNFTTIGLAALPSSYPMAEKRNCQASSSEARLPRLGQAGLVDSVSDVFLLVQRGQLEAGSLHLGGASGGWLNSVSGPGSHISQGTYGGTFVYKEQQG